eukprot:359397-Chlamydomonas_euryale.AAC.4
MDALTLLSADALASLHPPQVPANLLLVKNMTMHGIFWGSYMQARPRVLLDGMAEVLARIADGSLVVHVSPAVGTASCTGAERRAVKGLHTAC